MLSSNELDHESHNIQTLDFPIYSIPSYGSASGIDSAFPHSLDSAEAIPKRNGIIMIDAPNVPFNELIETDEQNELVQTRNMEHACQDTETVQLSDELFPCVSPAPPSGRTSVRLYDTDWQAVINWSPSMRSSIGASSRIVNPEYRSFSKSPTVQSDNSPSNQGFNKRGIPQPLDSLGRLISTGIDVEVQSKHPIIPEGIDPTTLLLPLQLMKSHLTKCLYLSTKSRWYSRNSGVSIHDDLARDKWLELELEDLLCWSCESFAKAVRKRQSRRKRHNDVLDSEIDEPSESQMSSNPSGRASGKTWSVSNFQARRTDYSLSISRAGILRATLGTVPNEETNADTSEGFLVLDLAFMPTENERTRGVCVTFARTVNEFSGSSISPHLKVFNVIPDDSEIFGCVSRNDLHGMQQLFERREASPTDVDKHGFSLLSVRIQAVQPILGN